MFQNFRDYSDSENSEFIMIRSDPFQFQNFETEIENFVSTPTHTKIRPKLASHLSKGLTSNFQLDKFAYICIGMRCKGIKNNNIELN